MYADLIVFYLRLIPYNLYFFYQKMVLVNHFKLIFAGLYDVVIIIKIIMINCN